MSCSYRYVEKEVEHESKIGKTVINTYYEIHEVYYDEDGNITMCSKEAITPFEDDSIDSLLSGLYKMQEAFNKPILLEKDLINLFKI